MHMSLLKIRLCPLGDIYSCTKGLGMSVNGNTVLLCLLVEQAFSPPRFLDRGTRHVVSRRAADL